MSRHRVLLVMGVALLVIARSCTVYSCTVANAALSKSSLYAVQKSDVWAAHSSGHSVPGTLQRIEGELDWWTEYENYPEPNRSTLVRLSGHSLSVDALVERLHRPKLRTQRVGRWSARVGRGLGGEPALVLLAARRDYALMILSYELGPQDLVRWAGTINVVPRASWATRTTTSTSADNHTVLV